MKPSDAASSNREHSGPYGSTIKNDICQQPNLDLSLLPFGHPMRSFPNYRKVNPLDGHSITFPVSSSPNLDIFRSLSSGAEQPRFAHLTIFYEGKVNVYNVSAAKAHDIMAVASTISGSPGRGSLSSSASTPSTPLYSAPPHMDMPPISHSPSTVRRRDHTIKVALPTVREFSVMKFLKKRNDRLHRTGPYARHARKK